MKTKPKKKVATKVRYYGVVKVPVLHKGCWISKHDKNGWSLGYALSNRTIWLKGLRFKTSEEIKIVLAKNIVFVELKGKNKNAK